MRLQLDHLYGRPVVSVKGKTKGDWQIVLEGEVTILNGDGRLARPDEVKPGMIFANAVLSDTETRLVFSEYDENQKVIRTVEVSLNAVRYSLLVREYSDMPYNPQQAEIFVKNVPEEPKDRIKKGPDEAN